MGVQPCEIEFDRFLLLIGEQASGKSTIAKLIYFFQSLPDAIYDIVIENKKSNIKNNSIDEMAATLFFKAFGSLRNLNSKLLIGYDYGTFTIVIGRLVEDNQEGLRINLQEKLALIISVITNYNEPKRDDLTKLMKDEIDLRKEFLTALYQIFNKNTSINNYLIAGRNNVVAYSEYFEKIIELENEKAIEEKVKGQDLFDKTRTGNERLLLEFVNWSSNIRKYFQNNGGTFNTVKSDLENKSALNTFEKIAKKILKGDYRYDSNGEYLSINEKERIQMKDASSGQQESLRILQGFFLSIGLKNRREFFVVEEPEAHLYPLAQKELINAFALFLNTIKEGRLIITTHSPYILACVNILLFANYVANELPEAGKEVLESVQKEFWLDSKMFSAYSLGHGEVYCTNIKDSETGLIDQNYLDAISEQLGTQYNHLYNLLLESHV